MKSNIAEEIDEEYKLRKSFSDKLNKYIKEHCYRCKNKQSNLCHVVIGFNGRANCINYEEDWLTLLSNKRIRKAGGGWWQNQNGKK